MIPISDVRKVSGGGDKRAGVQPRPQRPSVFGDDSPAAAVTTALLEDALTAGATAIHIEPERGMVHVRYRIDGLLHEGKPVPPDTLIPLTKRLKHLAHLEVAETRVPHEGRFEAVFDNRSYVMRVNMLPVAEGEKVVIHITEQSGSAHELEALGFWGQALQVLKEASRAPRGMVAVGGPTGSGKTSTLYGLLGLAMQPGLSVATVEDVVEHRLAGIAQTPVKNLGYADTLRAVLNQDPNIVMVSDIREPKTAALAAHAALGGRVVFVGLQAHDIAASVEHLHALRVEPYVLATSLRAVVNQRLVRRLCVSCRESFTPSQNELNAICQATGLRPSDVKAHITNLQSLAAADLGIEPVHLSGSKLPLWRAHEGGCNACGGRGYKGRLAIAEAVSINTAMQKLITSRATGGAMYDQAVRDGMVPLPLDGLVKVVLGLTSVDEVLRAVA